jgi:hypothetical protein
MAELVTAAKEGDKITIRGTAIPVGPKCGTDAGYWICLTHPEDYPMSAYRNQFQKDMHVSRGEHVLAWVCREHGPEVP